ncbi:hypothetical protein [Devosia sp. CAU 1758]
MLDLLTTAEGHIRADRLSEAATLYRQVLAEPALDDLPTAKTEAFANYGALLLHEVRSGPTSPDRERMLTLAIDLLTQARMGHNLGKGDGSSAVSDTNLALAYFQRHLVNGEDGDLMSAHIALDSAESAVAAEDWDMLEWIRSIQAQFSQKTDRRSDPR